jgi:Tol biopolymer transport system component
MGLPPGLDNTSSEEVLNQLHRILTGPQFRQSDRLKRFLTFAIEKTLEGDLDRLKESVIGVEVFDRAPGYDPKTDAIVRVEAHRLRQKLQQYYEADGAQDPIRFVIPKGRYGVQFVTALAPGGEETATPIPSVRAAEPDRTKRPWIPALAAAVLAGLGIVWLFATRPVERRPLQLERLTSYSGWSTDPVLAPDGKAVIFSSDLGADGPLSIWKLPLPDGVAQALTPGSYDAIEPDISPDGKTVVFRSRRPEAPGLYVTSIEGGQSAWLLVQNGVRPRYSPNGKWILYTVTNEQEWGPSKLFGIPAAGGPPRELVTGFDDAHYGIWSPDGRSILFCGTKRSNSPNEEHDWWVINFDDGPPRLTKTQVYPEYVKAHGGKSPPNTWLEQPSDWVGNQVYAATVRGALPVLVSQRLSADFRAAGAPELLTLGPSMDTRPRVRGKSLVFASGSFNIDLWGIPIGSKSAQPQTRLTNYPGIETFPTASPDGHYIGYISDRQGRRQLYVKDTRTQAEHLVQASQYSQDHPVISPDGKQIAFREIRKPRVPILIAPIPGGPARVLHPDSGAPASWSPDGRFLLYEPGATVPFIGRLDLAKNQTEVFLVHPDHALRGAAYSPDGQWIAFYAEEGRTTRRLYIAPAGRTTLPRDWIAVDRDKRMSYNPAWARDGASLYFLSEADGHRCIYNQPLDPATKRARGPAVAVYHNHNARRSLLRLTRARLSAIGPVLLGNQLLVAMDEQLADIYTAQLP